MKRDINKKGWMVVEKVDDRNHMSNLEQAEVSPNQDNGFVSLSPVEYKLPHRQILTDKQA